MQAKNTWHYDFPEEPAITTFLFQNRFLETESIKPYHRNPFLFDILTGATRRHQMGTVKQRMMVRLH
ncbi:hypothetical protein C0Z17_00535 [Trinickia caryophylli]|nr:hypothetical protein C0Z17_00535 [Trinickia caryophylli]